MFSAPSTNAVGQSCESVAPSEVEITQEMLKAWEAEAVSGYTIEWEDGKPVTRDLGVEQGLAWVQELGQQMAEDALAIGRTVICEDLSGDISCANDSITWAGKGRSKMEPAKQTEYIPEGEKQVPVSVLKIGNDIAFVATQPEMNAVTERQLQEKSPIQNTLLVTMVNGGMKYLPDQDSFDQVTWEALSSMLMPGGAEELIRKAIAMLNAV